jgi:hypothetical protein
MVIKSVDRFEVSEYTTTHKIKDLAALCLLVGLGYMLAIIMFLA